MADSRLGPVLPISPVRSINASASSQIFQAQAGVTQARFMLLHFSVGLFDANDEMEVKVTPGSISGYTPSPGTTDIFDSTSGSDFWTRPIPGSSVTITLRRKPGQTGAVSSHINLDKYAHGYGVNLFMIGGASDAPSLPSNMLDPYGIYPPALGAPYTSNPGWRPIASASATSTYRTAANRVGLIVYVRPPATSIIMNGITIAEEIGSSTAALYDDELILTAAHSVSDLDTLNTSRRIAIHSGSFTLDYEAGLAVSSNAPHFYKLRQLMKNGTAYNPAAADESLNLDYAVVQFSPPVTNVPPLQIDTAPQVNNSELFVIHHPATRTKQITYRSSGASPDPDCLNYIADLSALPAPPATPVDVRDKLANVVSRNWFYDIDCDAGSSGSPVFNTAGNMVGILTNTLKIITAINYYSFSTAFLFDHMNRGAKISEIIADYRNTSTVPDQLFQLAVVVDISGSMSLPGRSGRTKMAEAIDAVSEFFSMLKANNTPPHSVALIAFSTDATVKQSLIDFTAAARTSLIGPNNQSGIVQTLSATGLTSIGDGLDAAQAQLTSTPNKIKAILLMTDGMQNEPQSIANVLSRLTNIRIDVIGFGRDGELDTPLMSQLANTHGGTYTHAYDGLALKKFYATIYGRIFESSVSFDPEYVISAGESSVSPIDFIVGEQNSLRVALGWEHTDAELDLKLRTPSGTEISTATAGVQYEFGETWTHLQMPIPFNREPEGNWQILVERLNRQPLRFRAHDTAVTSVTYSPKGNSAVSGGADLFQWDVVRGRLIRRLEFEPTAVLRLDEGGYVQNIAFSPDGNLIAVTTGENYLRLYDAENGRQTKQLTFPEVQRIRLSWVAFSPNGSTIVSGGNGIHLWNVSTGKFLNSIAPQTLILNLIFRSLDGFLIAAISTPSENGASVSVLTIDTASGEMKSTLQLPDLVSTFDLVFSPDARFLYAIVIEREHWQIKQYDVQTGEYLATFESQDSNPFSRVSISPNGRWLSALARWFKEGDTPSGGLLLWDAQSREFIRRIDGDQAELSAAAFSPDGTKALTASLDSTVMQWNIPDGTPTFGPLDTDERFVVTTVVTSNIYMTQLKSEAPPYYYTGEDLYPQIILRRKDGSRVQAKVRLEIEVPTNGTGNVLVANGPVQDAQAIRGDVLDARAATLVNLQSREEQRLIPTEIKTFELFDDARHFDGGMEPDGIYGNKLEGITRYEGNYQLRAVAELGDAVKTTREVTWAIYVVVKIDGGQTEIKWQTLGDEPGGKKRIKAKIIPKDKYKNNLGPGRSDLFVIPSRKSTETSGPIQDNGDGSYDQEFIWDPNVSPEPDIVIQQPGRAPETVKTSTASDPTDDTAKRQQSLIVALVALLVSLIILRHRRSLWFWLFIIIVLLIVWLLLNGRI